MGSLGLLHIAQTVVDLATVDPIVVAVALAALAVAVATIWLPRPETPLRVRISRRARRRAGSLLVAAFVFFALLPSVLPYDHLFGDNHARGALASGEREAVHASHCHITPGTCSDAPVTAGPGQLFMSAPLVVTPAMLAVLITAAATVLVGISLRPEVRPPLLPSA